jgi:hypothetical protein
LWALWGDEARERMTHLLIGDGNIIDTASNMVALAPHLHRWWGMASFGLEPIEKIERGIRLRFRWLPRTGLAMGSQIPLDSDPREFLSLSRQVGNTAAHDSGTSRPIKDGHIFDITAKTLPANPDDKSAVAYDESTVPSWDLFCLQWDLVRMASLCGAAEVVDEGDCDEDDDDGVVVGAVGNVAAGDDNALCMDVDKTDETDEMDETDEDEML